MLFRTYLKIVVVTGLCCGCGKTADIDDPAQKVKPQVEENAAIDDALKAQLKALGYPQPEAEKGTAAKKENPYTNVDIDHFMEGIEGTFVFLDVAKDIRLVYNEARAKTPFSPYPFFRFLRL